jgi:aryl-alcohol dehydrogenase-like predicted oxidoreductase
VLGWGPLAGGLLTGKYLPRGTQAEAPGRLDADDRRLTERNLSIAAQVARIASELNTTPATVALAWLRARGTPPIPILGARTAEQLDQLLGCLELDLPEAVSEHLDRSSAVQLGYPHDFLARIRVAYAPPAESVSSEAKT